MPPIMGTAIRCMISEPVPVLHMIGSRPAMMATTVIIFGRTRSTAPSMMASYRSRRVSARPSAARLALILRQGMVEIDQHHHAGFGGDAGKRDEADDDGHRKIEAEPPHQPNASDQGERQREHDDHRVSERAE